LLAYDGLEVDESALTGEPIDVEKCSKQDPFLLSGCTATAGSGQFLAIAVGKDSQWGVIKSHLEKEQEETPLQEKLDDMAAMIGYVGMVAAAATFVAMMCIKLFVKPDYLANVSTFHHALDAFIIGVTIVVVAVPEGLPLAVTISLAFSTKKMLADQNLIRHLAACETMGNATNICSDKTGTLTENRMTVVKGVFANQADVSTANPSGPIHISKQAKEIILQGVACCSTARVVAQEHVESAIDPEHPVIDSRPTVIGNKTEAALLILTQSEWGDCDDADVRRAAARFGKPGGSRLFPFSSARKRMSVLVVNGHEDSSDAARLSSPQRVTRSNAKHEQQTWTLYHKGAAETVLESCTTFLDTDGSEQVMTASKRKQFEKLITEYASEALRCVALAHRNNVQTLLDPTTATVEDCAAKLENNMCFDALVGIADPLRADVIDAVATCQNAGIFVRMVTGDNLDTANAIAKQAGILTKDGISMTGDVFRKLTPAQLDEMLPRLQVLARSSPEDKHMLVQRLNGGLMPKNEQEWLEAHPGKDYATQRDLLLPGYKEEWALSRHGVGEVVGVTGDGTNDGPALKAADVGLSMGLSGTDVAKKASDIIIMDDNFASIVKAVLWGRSVFDNIRKFLQFQLTVNIVALTITFLSAIAGYKPPLNAVMMLWVNLIMDTMGALALGTEPPRMELLDRRPYRRDASLVSRPMWRNIFVQATYQLALLVFLLNKGPVMFNCEDGSSHHFTILFNAFVFCQVFNEFNAREIGDVFDPLRSLDKSRMFLMVIAFTVIAQWCIVEYGGDFTQTYPLTFDEWKITASLGAISLPLGWFMRQIPVQEDPESFAGVGGKKVKKRKNVLRILLLALAPVLVAIIYQLYWEVEELKH
jgi:magnesium-transporting ATPase (P-type)